MRPRQASSWSVVQVKIDGSKPHPAAVRPVCNAKVITSCVKVRPLHNAKDTKARDACGTSVPASNRSGDSAPKRHESIIHGWRLR
ncbi:hypothetical protein, partial [Sporolactobacillus inulinus]|uniref:hypothetical protein n=1 Tax=Sporolactobacillus inulinus TaxID=2078 RepID=UPI001ED996A6